MSRLPFLPLCFLTICTVVPALCQEAHLSEPGSGVIYSRSAFVHGYRHGYEEGYHLGNLDINMSRLARTKKSHFSGRSLGYSPDFGPKKLFEAGFHAGVAAGYCDGYTGRVFRAVDSVRAIAVALDQALPSAEQKESSFDQGLAGGYRDGFDRKDPAGPPTEILDFRNISCAQRSGEGADDSGDPGGYCEGYRRGFFLGHADALVVISDRAALEASK